MARPSRLSPPTHHAREGQQGDLDLGHVPILIEIVGLKEVNRLQPVVDQCLDEVGEVLKLAKKEASGARDENKEGIL